MDGWVGVKPGINDHLTQYHLVLLVCIQNKRGGKAIVKCSKNLQRTRGQHSFLLQARKSTNYTLLVCMLMLSPTRTTKLVLSLSPA
jgi:hypothetical protein